MAILGCINLVVVVVDLAMALVVGRHHQLRVAATDSADGQNRPHCQVRQKLRHTLDICWYRFDDAYAPENCVASTSYGNDLNWYLNAGATDHITSDLEQFTMHERYHGGVIRSGLQMGQVWCILVILLCPLPPTPFI
jgi:hypothetical protein